MAADIVKQGYVKFLSKNLGNLGVWNKKWLMLRRQSCKGSLRLERYKDEETAAVMSVYGSDKKIIDLTRVDRIERLPESVKKHGVSILVDASLSIQFCVGSEMEAESWLSAIRDELHPENRQTHESFQVYMLPNDYMSTPGDCNLQLTRDSIQLLERYGGRELATWPLSGLRRFGVERNMFTFEAGSSCPTGRGTYFFSGRDFEFIFQRVQSLSQSLSRTNPSEAQGNWQSSFSMSNWGNVSSIHELSNRRAGGGGGQTTNQENAYNFDTSMPTHRPPERLNNSVQSSSRSTNRGGGRDAEGQSAADVYSEVPSEASRRIQPSVGQYGLYRGQETQPTASVRPSATRSNTVDATGSSTSHLEVQGVGGPYYAVSRPKNNNLTANQGPPTTQSSQAPGNESRRVPTERSRTGNVPAGPPQDSAQPRAEGQIKAVRMGGDYYAVARSQNANPREDGPSDLV